MKSLALLGLLALCGSVAAADKEGAASVTSSAPSATSSASEVKHTCPAKYDAKCGFICGQKSIDFWYCSDKNIFPDPTDDNWCTPCPGGPKVPGKYGPSTIPASVLATMKTSTTMEGEVTSKSPSGGKAATTSHAHPEGKATAAGQSPPEGKAATTGGKPSQTSSLPAPVFSSGASGVKLGSAAVVGFLGLLLAF
ncbi:hypothetical protein TWF281_002394 [Arthrobotrys megalospora]